MEGKSHVLEAGSDLVTKTQSGNFLTSTSLFTSQPDDDSRQHRYTNRTYSETSPFRAEFATCWGLAPDPTTLQLY
jgi:hypothetical protein